MKCPVCHTTLTSEKFLHVCSSCYGLWFVPEELPRYFRRLVQKKSEIPHLKIELNREVVGGYLIKEQLKKCPRCGVSMKKFNYGYNSNVILDKCTHCGSIWVDKEEEIKLASYFKSHPLYHGLGEAIIQEMEEREKRLKQLEELSQISSRPVSFLPILISDENIPNIVPWSVLAIIFANTLVEIYQLFQVEDVEKFFYQYGLIPERFFNGSQLFVVLTSMYIHAGIFHLLANMFFLWIFGDNIEERLGHWWFILFYNVVGVIGALIYIMTASNLNFPIIGASNAISGIMGAYFVEYPKSKLKTLFLGTIFYIPAYIYLLSWVGLQIALSILLGLSANIAFLGHIGGFIAGAIIMYITNTLQKYKNIS